VCVADWPGMSRPVSNSFSKNETAACAFALADGLRRVTVEPTGMCRFCGATAEVETRFSVLDGAPAAVLQVRRRVVTVPPSLNAQRKSPLGMSGLGRPLPSVKIATYCSPSIS
jgi:hypothetical protein